MEPEHGPRGADTKTKKEIIVPNLESTKKIDNPKA